MSFPSLAERERAKKIYVYLAQDRRRVGQLYAESLTLEDARFCLTVILRQANHVADTFGLPRPRVDADARTHERCVDWLDRVATHIGAWREGNFERGEDGQKRRRGRRHATGT